MTARRPLRLVGPVGPAPQAGPWTRPVTVQLQAGAWTALGFAALIDGKRPGEWLSERVEQLLADAVTADPELAGMVASALTYQQGRTVGDEKPDQVHASAGTAEG